MNLIVAADKNWAIGNKGRLLVTIRRTRSCSARRLWERSSSWEGRPWRACREARPFRDVPMWSSQGTGIIKKRE